jgi:hypothetical protein
MKIFTNLNILPVTLFKLLVAVHRKPPVILYAGDDFEACYGITFHNRRMIECRGEAELRLTIPFELPPVLLGGWEEL